jgi:hypothetical protein
MHWLLNPRLNSAVATVAVLMVFSLLRVASPSFVIVFGPSYLSFRAGPKDQTSDAQLRIGETREFRVRCCASPWNDELS